jgi:hypothetical protein
MVEPNGEKWMLDNLRRTKHVDNVPNRVGRERPKQTFFAKLGVGLFGSGRNCEHSLCLIGEIHINNRHGFRSELQVEICLDNSKKSLVTGTKSCRF